MIVSRSRPCGHAFSMRLHPPRDTYHRGDWRGLYLKSDRAISPLKREVEATALTARDYPLTHESRILYRQLIKNVILS